MLISALSEELKIDQPNLFPIVRELPADLETPVSVYLKLAGESPSFLLESVTGGEQIARYSFIGVNPSQAYVLRGRTMERHMLHRPEAERALVSVQLSAEMDPLDALRDELARFRPELLPGLPRFCGGLAGYLGYDASHFFEPRVPRDALYGRAPDDGSAGSPPLPDAIFLLADTLVAFDHAYGRLLLIANVHTGDLDGQERTEGTIAERMAEAEQRLDDLQQRLSVSLDARAQRVGEIDPGELTSNTSREEFTQAVAQAKEYIAAGEIFQVVLSQRFSRRTQAQPFEIFRALRRLNPSPYMFFFDFGRLAGGQPLRLIGASPEMHVRLEGGRASLRPIAGTRSRGATPAEDLAQEADLLADPKERAEHVMLVDLARNDLGRVCEYGSVHVPEQMAVERYSHVMHIVSHVEGALRPALDGFDLLRATFPAGTVSGAPKIRAMQIIAELENEPRGPYAGAVGYFSYDGSLDTCITIRTLVMQGETVSVQAGAGVVADSDPEREYQETLNKARALATALKMAEG